MNDREEFVSRGRKELPEMMPTEPEIWPVIIERFAWPSIRRALRMDEVAQ